MYKINKINNLYKLCIRGNNLTKKLNKNTTKQTLVFLRAPKHFNIGKRRVLSFKNFHKFFYNLNLVLHTRIFLKNEQYLFNILNEFHKFHILYRINSIKISSKIKIKW